MNTQGPLVLIIEDEEPIRRLIADVLEECGYSVMLAGNGMEALDALDTAKPEVMVLDLLMPVMHGWAFMESYLEKTGGQPLPIVVVSVNPALPRSFSRFGVRQVVSKPFNVDALLEAVDHAVQPVPA